ncbi:MAG: Wzz/FepE/Etk N-terminal domain-containing protein [Enterovibrio sp.]
MKNSQFEPALPVAYQAPAPADDEIDLRELFITLWRGKWIIVASTFLFAIAAALFAINKPNIYQADILVAPAETASGGGLANMASKLGGLANIAGISLGNEQNSTAAFALQVMKSRQFVDAFIKKYDLLVPLMAAKGWDLENNQLLIDESIFDSATKKWLREPDALRSAKPTAQEAYQHFTKNVLTVTETEDGAFYTVAINHFSPFIAKQWVTWLVDDINKVMRELTITENTRNLAYLQIQLKKTAVADMQSTLYRLIEEQTKSLMLAEVQDEFVFKVVDPAVVPEVASSPKRMLIVVLGTMLGGMIGIILVLLFHFMKGDDRQ